MDLYAWVQIVLGAAEKGPVTEGGTQSDLKPVEYKLLNVHRLRRHTASRHRYSFIENAEDIPERIYL